MFVTILILAAIALLGSWFAYHIAFYSPKKSRASVDDLLTGEQYDAVSGHIFRISHIMEQYTFEPVRITASDGTELFGRYYHLKDGAPVEILFHGYRSHPFRDCSGGHALSRKIGFNTLVVDQRGQGSSGGHTISFGILEHRDCLRWINYVCARFGSDVPIVLSGLSMGAATVLMASGLDLPENVACIIADSPYSTPSAIIEKVAKDRRYPVALCRPFVHLAAFLFGGFRLNNCTAKEAVGRCKVPVLLIHGEDDRLVPCSMSLEIAACCASRVQVVTFPDAGHGLSYVTDPVRYERIVVDFLNSVPVLKGFVSDAFIRNDNDNP